VLVEHGFRLPSAKDNRPLNFNEFLSSVNHVIFASATPGDYEKQVSPEPVQQIVRPTGLLDPKVRCVPLKNQIDDLMERIRDRADKKERTLVTTLTKKTAEDLTEYLKEAGLKVNYLHSDIDVIDRVEILRSLRKGDFDCLIGINLLREGLDLPEVSLVAILDADKEGFLRSETALIQTAGRAARHLAGQVILYADNITDSMKRAMDVMEHRRKHQIEYNKANNITPRTIKKKIQAGLQIKQQSKKNKYNIVESTGENYNIYEAMEQIQNEMLEAADRMQFERAAVLRDQLFELQRAVPHHNIKQGKKIIQKQKNK
jgi:excinuclease ABC subunit B